MISPLRLDHVVVLVPDLDRAVAVWTAHGFTVVPGGAHQGSPTHNALIGFADGSYLELLARRPGATEPARGLAARLLRRETVPGLADFALSTPDLEAVVAAGRAAGTAHGEPQRMGRIRPDGQRLAWTIALPAGPDLPFLIADETPRGLRLPDLAACAHANGAAGIAQVTVLVRDLAASRARYRALLGAPDAAIAAFTGQEPPGTRAAFDLQGTIVELIAPERAEDPLARRLAERGEGPAQITLQVPGLPGGRPLATDPAYLADVLLAPDA